MAEIISASTQWPLLPYKASSKSEQEELLPFSFEPSFGTDSFDFDAALLEFDFDGGALMDATSLDNTFGDEGDLFIPNDFGNFGIVPSVSSCSLASHCSSSSTTTNTDGFPYKVPTGTRSRRAHDGKHSCPSHLKEAALQLPKTGSASRLSRTYGADNLSIKEEAAEQLPASDALLFDSYMELDFVSEEAAMQLHLQQPSLLDQASYDDFLMPTNVEQQVPEEAARQLPPPHSRSGPILSGAVTAVQSVDQTPLLPPSNEISPAAAEAAQQLPAYQSTTSRVSSDIIVQSRSVDIISSPSAVTRPSWPTFDASTLGMTRQQRVQRYREKRKRRTFEKTIRYEARRAYAEVRPRIKGRFATKEEAAAIRAAQVSGVPCEL